jgi:hypothetical protein
MPSTGAEDADELSAAAAGLSVQVKIFRKDVESGSISGFVYSSALQFADETALVEQPLHTFLEGKVDAKVRQTTLRKLVLGWFELPDGPDGPGSKVGVLVFHCKSFKQQTDVQAAFVAHALTLAREKLGCPVFVVGDMNLTAKWPKGTSVTKQYEMVRDAPKYQMPELVRSLTDTFDAELAKQQIKTYPPGPVLTTLKMRTKFQAQADKEGELSAVHKDFVILPSNIPVLSSICGGRIKVARDNLELLQPSRLWPCDHFTVMVVV